MDEEAKAALIAALMTDKEKLREGVAHVYRYIEPRLAPSDRIATVGEIPLRFWPVEPGTIGVFILEKPQGGVLAVALVGIDEENDTLEHVALWPSEVHDERTK